MTRGEATLVEQLLECAVEMHSTEMNNYHGGDAEQRGLAPHVCSYCNTFEDVARHVGLNLNASIEAISAGD